MDEDGKPTLVAMDREESRDWRWMIHSEFGSLLKDQLMRSTIMDKLFHFRIVSFYSMKAIFATTIRTPNYLN